MKKQFVLLAALCLLMASCEDSAEVRDAKGSYRFKTTGKVTLTTPDETNPKATVSTVINLTNETGWLRVKSLKDGDKVMLTFDQLNGDVYHTEGTLSGKDLTFNSFKRTLEVPVETEYVDTITIPIIGGDTITRTVTKTEMFDITVSGTGRTYEDDCIIFTLNYSGESQTDKQHTIEGTGIEMHCNK